MRAHFNEKFFKRVLRYPQKLLAGQCSCSERLMLTVYLFCLRRQDQPEVQECEKHENQNAVVSEKHDRKQKNTLKPLSSGKGWFVETSGGLWRWQWSGCAERRT
jgi:hypothetical protein